MSWLNIVGLITIIGFMIPNIINGINHPDTYNNIYENKVVLFLEQIGRYGCIVLMIINVPYTYLNFWFDNAFIVYDVVVSILLCAYIIGWIICWNKYNIFKAYFLSIIPSFVFLFTGLMLLYFPLIVLSLIFSFSHITISLKNAYKKVN